MISLAAFVALHTGKWRDFDGRYGAQCVDIVEFYLRDVLGDPPLPGNAINEFGEDSRHWLWVRNDPRNLAQIPAAGDVMIWGADARIGTSTLGHTAIVLAADRNGFTSFDQNWPRGAPCHAVRHSYRGIVGWGIPKAVAAPAPPRPVPVPPAPTPAPPPAPVPAPPVVEVPPVTTQPAPPPLPDLTPPPAAELPPTIEIPEPAIVAEAGVTTSEWKLAVRYLVQLAAVGTAGLVDAISQNVFHASVVIPGPLLDAAVKFEIAGGVVVVGYAVSRGIRKLYSLR